MKLTLPVTELRPYQDEIWDTFAAYLQGKNNIDRYCLVAARRSGKDHVLMQMIALSMIIRPGTYGYFFDTITNARDVMMMEPDAHTGLSKVESVLGELGLIEKKNTQSPSIELINGSKLIFCGSDDETKWRGRGFRGIVVSEAAFQNLNALRPVIRPMLDETQGWLAYVSTPNGKNAFYDICKNAEKNWLHPTSERQRRWYYAYQPVSVTRHMNPEDIEETKQEFIDALGPKEGLNEFNREYNCSFEEGMVGAVYDISLIDAACGEVEYNNKYPVYAAFDLGHADSTSIWVFQYYNNRFHFLETYQNQKKPLTHYWGWLRAKPYGDVVQCVLPHDARQEHLAAGGISIEVQTRDFGFRTMVLPTGAGSVNNRIRNTHLELQTAKIDAVKCKDGIRSLSNYSYDYIKRRAALSHKPKHDIHSHYAYSFGYAIMSKEKITKIESIVNRPQSVRITPKWRRK